MNFKDPKVIKKLSFFVDQLMQEWEEELDRYSLENKEWKQSEKFFAEDLEAQEKEREEVAEKVKERLDSNR